MPLSTEDFRFAINDARERHKATVDTIAGIDRQAISLLQLFVTLAAASLSGAGAILLSNTTYPLALGYGLLAFGVPTALSAVICMAAIFPADISLQGRDPDFWQWANREDVKTEDAYRHYLDNLATKAKQNIRLNIRLSRTMLAAKLLACIAPLTGLAAAIVALRIL